MKNFLWQGRMVVMGILLLMTLSLAACGSILHRNTNNVTSNHATTMAPGGSTSGQITPARIGSSMAYDGQAKRVVVFGGDNAHDTWTWDGHNWTQVHSAVSPTDRSDASMAYDAATRQLVLFGGVGPTGTALGDTWVWNGSNWQQMHPQVSPPARAQASLVYDAARQRLVLFGGETMGENKTSPTMGDTWVWNGSNWQQMHPQVSPPARAQANMTYDAAKQQVLLFGGTNGYHTLNDTWAWNGTNWTQLNPATKPSPRAGASMVYDAAKQQTILFGGSDSGSHDLGDIWLWNGQNWQQINTSAGPKGPYIVAAYDEAQQNVVVYALQMESNKTLSASKTWLWNGSSWMLAK